MSYHSIHNMNIDSHFHIFEKTSQNMEYSRYSIDYAADLDDWLKQSKSHKVTGGVIVQPSFLGYDNTLLLQTLDQNPQSFRGVASAPPNTNLSELQALRNQGIRGIRLNLFGDKNPFETIKANEGLISRLEEANLHLQIHHDDGLLNQLLLIIPKGVSIVIDHFGRPSSNDEFIKNSDGINKHIDALWVKLSAQYRTPKIDHRSIFEYWLAKIGDDRLLWGSDWPHTQFEDSQTYDLQMSSLNTLTNDPVLTKKILSINPKSLYWP